MATIATTIINSMRVKPEARLAGRARSKLPGVVIESSFIGLNLMAPGMPVAKPSDGRAQSRDRRRVRKYVTKIVASPVCAIRPSGAAGARGGKTNNDVIITFCY
jgi:hypothetical protein